jgi:uncharacterized protein involved in response to NO
VLSRFFSIGYRPFYLLGAGWAILAIPAWTLSWLGELPAPRVDIAWHSHEMLFGFAPAIVAGFLLTAVRNWTGRETAHGLGLSGLAALWLCGRIGVWAGTDVGALFALAFLPALAAVIAAPILAARNRRNYGVIAILLLWSAGHALFLAVQFGMLEWRWREAALDMALGALALLLAVVGGRVIPAFTANAVAAAKPRRWPVVEALALGGLVVLIAARVLGSAGFLPSTPVRVIAGVVALAHGVRLLGFVPWRTWGNVLLAALPLGYVWLPIHLALVAADARARAVHALTVGAVGGMMLAMMTRSALGHGGRPLVAGPWEIACFVLIQCAAMARLRTEWAAAAGLLFAAAFAVYLVRYVPILWGAPPVAAVAR